MAKINTKARLKNIMLKITQMITRKNQDKKKEGIYITREELAALLN